MSGKVTIAPKPTLESIDYYMVGISKLPGFAVPIKLSSNESALGMSPLALEAGRKALKDGHLYPEVDTHQIAEAIGVRFNLEPDRMAFGPGSDELLQRIVNAFAGPGQELIYSKNAYMQFPIYAKLAGATPVAAEDADLHYDVDSILGAVTDRTKIVLVANPDNPSGTHLGAPEMRRLHDGLPADVLLVIDAAYEEFATADDYESGTRLVHEYDNVIVTRTFSKIYGMAGLRLGWCYGPQWVIELLTRIGPSFPVNTVAYAAGVASVADGEHSAKVREHSRHWTDRIIDELFSLGLNPWPSQTNFVLVGFPSECGRTAIEVNDHLNGNGIIPRRFSVDSFADKLRFTVGRDWEMEKTLSVLGRFIKSA